jgi:hypothetical protein
MPDELAALCRRVSTLTGTPALTPVEYAALFAAIAAMSTEGQQDMNELSRSVRDRLQAEGHGVSRTQISFVLNGFRFAGTEIGGRNGHELARAWRENVLSLLDNAQVELSDAEFRLLDRWLLSFPEGSSRAAPTEVTLTDHGTAF